MKVKRINKGYTLFLSEHEYSMLLRIYSHFDIDKEWPHMNTGERRSWARRIRAGNYMRVDTDARTEQL